MKEEKTVKRWTKTGIQGLVRHSSGTYYARLFSGGKERWKSLRTTVQEVAKNRLREEQREAVGEPVKKARSGRMTVGAAITLLEAEIASGAPLRAQKKRHNQESSRAYRLQTLAALKKSWQAINGTEFATLEIRRVTKEMVDNWANAYRPQVSPPRFNNTLGTLRHLFDIAAQAGETYRNGAAHVVRSEVKPKKLTLPERATFPRFVEALRKAPHRRADDVGDFVEFLAYTGSRVDEANHVNWGDINFTRGTVLLRVTKNGEERTVPMIPEARALLERMRARRRDDGDEAPVLQIGEAQRSMDAAAKKIGMARITHHDLRHLFATVSIEAGVDIPTVSRWLGHKDGGALALRTYGHLRDEHSQAAAQRVTFAPAAMVESPREESVVVATRPVPART